ncbi:MAG: indole-3-glycerol phosphate synthase TrpC [Candidatus Aminicenantes bacterium]|nr:indole-3-glycerol phosphate synthase TrpC [Candidatus Aminicenantes bacterium]
MKNFIDEVLIQTRSAVQRKKKSFPMETLLHMAADVPPPLSFAGAIRRGKNIIAEVKKASPSKGLLYEGDRMAELACAYRKNGAAAVSMVTEEIFFKGRAADIPVLKEAVSLPILRKDFIVDEYQIVESRMLGADAVLLISSILSSEKLSRFLQTAAELHLDALVEVHDRDNLVRALNAGAGIIGINNRNLKTFAVDPATAQSLLPMIPEKKIKVVESGIKTKKDLRLYEDFPVQAFLIGEALITSSNPARTLSGFRHVLEGL